MSRGFLFTSQLTSQPSSNHTVVRLEDLNLLIELFQVLLTDRLPGNLIGHDNGSVFITELPDGLQEKRAVRLHPLVMQLLREVNRLRLNLFELGGGVHFMPFLWCCVVDGLSQSFSLEIGHWEGSRPHLHWIRHRRGSYPCVILRLVLV